MRDAQVQRARLIGSLDDVDEHQDAVVAGQLLRRMGAATAGLADRNGFTYGLLFEREQRLAAKRAKASAALTI